MNPKCKCCTGEGTVPTGTHSRPDHTSSEYVFTLDGKSKMCPGCDGTGVPVRLHKELGIKP